MKTDQKSALWWDTLKITLRTAIALNLETKKIVLSRDVTWEEELNCENRNVKNGEARDESEDEEIVTRLCRYEYLVRRRDCADTFVNTCI